MRVKVKWLEGGFEAGLESCGVAGGDVGLAGGRDLLMGDDHVQWDIPLLHAGRQPLDGAGHGGVAKRVVVGVAFPSQTEAPAIEVRAAHPVAFAGVPAPVSIVSEYCPAAIAGYEDVVAHFGHRVSDPLDTTTITSVAVMQDNRLRLDRLAAFVRGVDSPLVVGGLGRLDGEARTGYGDIVRRGRQTGSA